MILVKEEFLTEEKTVRAMRMGGPGVVLLWMGMKSYSSRNKTRGFVPHDVIETLPLRPRMFRRPLRAMEVSGLISTHPFGWTIQDDAEQLLERVEERRRQWRERKVQPRLRALVVDRHGLICGLCRRPISPGYLHIDHVVPFSKGGRTVLENLQPAHRGCNIAKGNRCDA